LIKDEQVSGEIEDAEAVKAIHVRIEEDARERTERASHHLTDERS
jgi:hypothetical protein